MKEVMCNRYWLGREKCECPRCATERKMELIKADPDYRATMQAVQRVAAFEAKHGPLEDLPKPVDALTGTKAGLVRMRSQKARGLALAAGALAYSGPRWLKPVKIEAILPNQGRQTKDKIAFPIFARPCPVRPRHGFVESRLVRNEKELLALLCETLEADPLGEVMLMRKLSGHASAVATDAGVVWGKGNDGVTAAKGKQWSIPVPAVAPHSNLTASMRHRSDHLKADIKGGIFIECVENHGSVMLVQMRDGPEATPVSGNYVPRRDYHVKEVLALNAWEQGDVNLLEWEKRVLGAPDGTAVYLQGSSLTSHLAVHALARKLAVVTEGKKPRVGALLQPAENQPHGLNVADYGTMAKAIRKRMPGAKRSRAAYAVGVLHAMSAWGAEKHLLQMRATGAAMMARLLVSACVGEARHFYAMGPGSRDKKARSAINWKSILGRQLKRPSDGRRSSGVIRSAVLEKVYRYSLPRLLELCKQAEKDFSGDWGQEGHNEYDRDGVRIWVDGDSGFGGPNWERSAKVARELIEALLKFERSPTAKRWERVVMGYNKGVAAAHNGGRLLDKWAQWSEIDACARNPQLGLLSPQAMFICTGVHMALGEHLPGWAGREAGKVAKAPKPNKWPPIQTSIINDTNDNAYQTPKAA